MGTAVGSDRAYASERDIQRRYDIAYQQCMYAKGNQLPGGYYRPQAASYPPPPPPSAPVAPTGKDSRRGIASAGEGRPRGRKARQGTDV